MKYLLENKKYIFGKRFSILRKYKTSYGLACMPDQGRNDAAGGAEKQANHIPSEQP